MSHEPVNPNDETLPTHHTRAGVIALDAVAGAVVGATAGLLGGPAGVIAGAVIGVAVGAGTGAAVETDHDREDEDAVLDREIGVTGGQIGEAPANAPPAHGRGFSAAAMGIGGGSGTTPAEGPIQSLEKE